MIYLSGRRGFTFVEVMAASAMAAILVLALAYLFSKTTPYFKRLGVRQHVLLDARTCMDAILDNLRNGKAGTLMISTPAGPPIIPNSRADFILQSPLASGTTAYAIYLANGTVYKQEFSLNGIRAPIVLASNVTSLMFTGDSRDPAIVSVTLRIDAPSDNSKNPNMSSILFPNQVAHLMESM